MSGTGSRSESEGGTVSIAIEPDGEQIRVELKDQFRFERVDIRSLDTELRRDETLVSAFDRAFSDAISREIDNSSESSTKQARVAGDRPAPAGPELRSAPPLPDTTGREPRWDLINAGTGARDAQVDLQALGRSRNDCVHVRLDPASSRGRIVFVDQGWLSQSTASTLASAITEAFQDAYDKRRI